MQQKYKENIQKAIKSIKVADHILYITYPVIRDKRLLLKSLDSIYEAIISMMNALLQYDFAWEKINLSPDPEENLNIFFNKTAPNYNISEQEIIEIKELIFIIREHKKSAMEFKRRNKLVIMSPHLSTTAIDVIKVKSFLTLARRLLEKTRFLAA